MALEREPLLESWTGLHAWRMEADCCLLRRTDIIWWP